MMPLASERERSKGKRRGKYSGAANWSTELTEMDEHVELAESEPEREDRWQSNWDDISRHVSVCQTASVSSLFMLWLAELMLSAALAS